MVSRRKLEKEICGALQSAIHAHGPINGKNKASAAKRVIGALKHLMGDFYDEDVSPVQEDLPRSDQKTPALSR